jgi:transglutaminase-like putative cysteine protease
VTLPTTATDAAREVVTIKALRGNWLPTPFAPVAVQLKGNTAVFDPGSATLVSADRLGKGDTYVVWSSATGADVSAPTSDDVSIPRAVRQRLSSLVNQIVRNAGAVTVTQKAQALEAYFLDNFTYDLNVAAGSSITDITTFLQRRSGYCEQFAATFAAMARVLGIPSRVAIGYRLGTYDSTKGLYRVTGQDAHAWPEVYIAGQWVRFEPTPSSADGTSDASTAAAASAADAAAVASSPGESPTTTAPTATATDPTVDPSSSDGTVSTGHAADRHALVLVGALVLAVLVAPVLVGRFRARRVWRRVRHDRRGQIAWMWRDARRWLGIAGVDARATDTPLEVARRAALVVPIASSDIVELARLVTAACYAEASPDPADVDAARLGVGRVERGVKAHGGKAWRLRSYLAHFRLGAVRAASTGSSPAPSRLPIVDW